MDSGVRLARAQWRAEVVAQLRREFAEADRADGRTAEGRAQLGLARALRVLGADPWCGDPETAQYGGTWIGQVRSGSGLGDAVDVVVNADLDQDGVPDPMPVRVVVHDGATGATAAVFLTVAEARELSRLLAEASQHAETVGGG
jgi:hypothetical protein